MTEFENQPARDVDAERSALGGMLLSKDAITDVMSILRSPEDFYEPAHAVVYGTIIELFGSGRPADPVTVAAELTRSGQLMRVGGAPYLHTLISSVPTAANAGFYAGIVAEQARLRRLTKAGIRITQLGRAGQGGDIDELEARAQQEIFDLISAYRGGQVMSLDDLLPSAFAELDMIHHGEGPHGGVLTGFAELDQVTNGLHPGQMIIIAARPAIGKSTGAVDICRSCAIAQGLPALFFSLEMSRMELVFRILSAEAKIPLNKMRTGKLDDDDWKKLARKMASIAEAPLYIDDSPGLTMADIRARATRLKHTSGLSLVVVDYLQLLTGSGKSEKRQEEVAQFSRALKLLAKELEVPVIAVCQLNRNAESRADKRPQMSDLRESGQLEQDADMILLLHRDDAYEKDSPRAGEADWILIKHRNGPTAELTLAFQGHYSRFVDMGTT